MSKNYALVIGNSFYDNKEKFQDIPYCRNDANEIFRVLTGEKYSIFSSEASSLALDVTKEELHFILEDFFSKITSDGLVLIYFAGHGKVMIGGKTFHFVMKNTQNNGGTLAGTSFNVETILPYFSEKNIHNYIIIIDACYAGKAIKTSGFRDRKSNEDTEFEHIKDAFSGDGKIIITSAADYQPAKEIEELNHGLFTYYFIEGIESGNATNKWSEYIDIKQVYDYASCQLRLKHGEIEQYPVYSGQVVSGNIWISKNPNYTIPKKNEETVSHLIATSQAKNKLDELKEELKKREQIRETVLEFHALQTADISVFFKFIIQQGELLGLSKQIIEDEINSTCNFLNFKKFKLSDDTIKVLNGKGRATWFATAHGNKAIELPDYGYGVFSYFLSEALRGKASNNKGIVTLEDAYEYVENHLSIGFDNLVSFKQKSILIDNFKTVPILTASDLATMKISTKREAIVIGIDNYLETSIPPLHCAEKDARSIATMLTNIGAFNCTKLLGANASKKRVLKTIKDITKGMSENDMFLLYFSGHGLTTDENGHIVLYDTENKDLSTTLSLTELDDIKSEIKVGTILFIFDACLSPRRVN